MQIIIYLKFLRYFGLPITIIIFPIIMQLVRADKNNKLPTRAIIDNHNIVLKILGVCGKWVILRFIIVDFDYNGRCRINNYIR